MKIKNTLFVITAALTTIAFSGCRSFSNPNPEYLPEPGIIADKSLVPIIIIEKVKNAQPHEETLPFSPNTDPWILLPLCFYSSEKVDPMVKRNFFQNNLDEALQRLFVQDLRASNIAEQVLSLDTTMQPPKCWKGKYRLELILRHAVWNRNLTAYGLSYPGTLLWTIGLPTSYGNVQLAIEANLYAPDNPAKPIATTLFKQEKKCVEFIYDQIGYQSSVSEHVLTEMFPDIAHALRNFIIQAVKKKK